MLTDVKFGFASYADFQIPFLIGGDKRTSLLTLESAVIFSFKWLLEAFARRCFVKKAFWKIYQNSQEHRISF